MFKINVFNVCLCCFGLMLFVLSFACFMAAGFSMGSEVKASTVNYTVGNDGIYITESFDNAVSYMQDNIISTTSKIINDGIAKGSIVINTVYDPNNENLNIVADGSV